MNLKKHLFTALLIMIFNFCFCYCKQYCNVKYQFNNGWSKYYYKQVTFESGEELNTATGSNNYEPFSNYALIRWRDDDISVIKLTTLLVCGSTLSCQCLNSMYHSLDGIDQQNAGWKICLSGDCD